MKHIPAIIFLAGSLLAADGQTNERFQPTWESITTNYRTPDWYMDAKFGIFIHWGVYSVPAWHDEWYPRWMYQAGENVSWRVHDHHVKTYGPVDKFGYKDFIPMFKAEKWDPKEWVALFKASGARYVVPVAEHHDGFSMYDSAINPWNSVAMGPHRDIIGELFAALRAEGLHAGLSSHRAENRFFYNGGRSIPSDVQDPKYAGLYGLAMDNRNEMDTPEGKAFLKDWLARSEELVDKYRPELVYFDVVGGWPKAFDPYIRQFASYYYNKADSWGTQVVINCKNGVMPPGSNVDDIERGVSESARPDYWQTDTSVGVHSWSYRPNEQYKPPKQLINEFVDVVSKNGGYLLNIGPRADGTIPDESREILMAFGDWLKVNGEAIYSTRPAAVAAEGPHNILKTGPGGDRAGTIYDSRDIRFVTRDGHLYAIALGWPEDGSGTWTITSLAVGKTGLKQSAVKSVELLGASSPVKWEQTAKGLIIYAPDKKPCRHAYAFRIN